MLHADNNGGDSKWFKVAARTTDYNTVGTLVFGLVQAIVTVDKVPNSNSSGASSCKLPQGGQS